MAEGQADTSIDFALVGRVAEGSEDALGQLYDRYAEPVFNAAYRLVGDRGAAEEVVQETFLTLWNRAERFDPAVGSLAAWLFTIARHRAVDRLRAAGRRPQLVSVSASQHPDETSSAALERLLHASPGGSATLGRGTAALGDPAVELDQAELRVTLRGALAAMPEAERIVISLAYRDQLSQSEIAARLGWPLGTVKTRTRRALLHLRMVLTEELGETLGPVLVADLAPEPAERGDRASSRPDRGGAGE